jgi:hypothetical protein
MPTRCVSRSAGRSLAIPAQAHGPHRLRDRPTEWRPLRRWRWPSGHAKKKCVRPAAPAWRSSLMSGHVMCRPVAQRVERLAQRVTEPCERVLDARWHLGKTPRAAFGVVEPGSGRVRRGKGLRWSPQSGRSCCRGLSGRPVKRCSVTTRYGLAGMSSGGGASGFRGRIWCEDDGRAPL